MQTHRQAIATLVLLVGCAAQDESPLLGERSAPFVHGSDSRVSMWQVVDARVRQAGESTMLLTAKVPGKPETGVETDANGDVHSPIDRVVPKSNNFAFQFNMCPGEPFATEPVVLPAGSGFLVSPRIVVTVAHNLEKTMGPLGASTLADTCKAMQFVFRHSNDTMPTGTGAVTTIPKASEDLFSCKRLLRWDMGAGGAPSRDMAVIELDRDTGRPGLDYEELPFDVLKNLDSVLTLGHPFGLPRKLSSGVVSTCQSAVECQASPYDAKRAFFSTLDVDGGNSGGVVLRSTPTGSLRVVGMAADELLGLGAGDLVPQSCPGGFNKIRVDTADEGTTKSVFISVALGTDFLNDFSITSGATHLADVNGDGREDLVTVVAAPTIPSGKRPVRVSISPPINVVSGAVQDLEGTGPSGTIPFPTPAIWAADHPNGEVRFGDTRGSGRSDMVVLTGGPTGAVYTLVANATSFAPPVLTGTGICTTADSQCRLGDVTGDGRADLVEFKNGGMFVAVASPSGQFAAPVTWPGSFPCAPHISPVCPFSVPQGLPGARPPKFVVDFYKFYREAFCSVRPVCELGDVNGDGKQDVVLFEHGDNVAKLDPDAPLTPPKIYDPAGVYVSLSRGASVDPATLWTTECFGYPPIFQYGPPGATVPLTSEICNVRDVNGDGMADVVTLNAKYLLPNVPIGNIPTPAEAIYVATASPDAQFRASREWRDPDVWGSAVCAGAHCLIGDINGDGRADLFVPTTRGNRVALSGTAP